MIQLDDVYLGLPTPEILEMVRQVLDPRHMRPWRRRAWPGSIEACGVAVKTGFDPGDDVEIGSLVWPSGASRWAHGHFLCGSAALETLLPKAYGISGQGFNPLTLKMSARDDARLDPTDQGTLETDLYLLPPVQLTSGSEFSGLRGYGEHLWLLNLVDERYFWWERSVGELAITGATTWASLFTDVVAALDLENPPAFSEPESEYLSPHPSLALEHHPAPVLLDALSANVGRRLVRNYDGTLRFTTPSGSMDTALEWELGESERPRRGGTINRYEHDVGFTRFESPFVGRSAVLPTRIAVSFPATFCNGDTAYVPPESELPEGAAAECGELRHYTVEITLSEADHNDGQIEAFDFSGHSGNFATLALRDTARALHVDKDQPLNKQELHDLALKIARNVWEWRAYNGDRTYNGILPVTPHGYLDEIRWLYGVRATGKVDVMTRVLGAPYQDDVFQYNHVQPDVCIAPEKDFLLVKTTSTITARSGAAPGTGTAVILDGTGDTLAETDQTIDVFSLLDVEIASGQYTTAHRDDCKFWIDCPDCGGEGGGTSGPLERCTCWEDEYEVEVVCGPCRVMPKYWWMEILTSEDSPSAGDCPTTNCGSLVGARVRLEHSSGCEWLGDEGIHCAFAELTLEGDEWILRVYNKSDCLLAELRKDMDAFACCGVNTGWTQTAGACTMTVSLEPDPCTCCPPTPVECPPDGQDVCPASPCCLEGLCDVNALVSNGVNSGNEDPTADCTTLDGYYQMTWVSACTWRSPLDANNTYAEMVLTAPFTWTLKVYGPAGQIATYRLALEDCMTVQALIASGLDLPFVAGESTCPIEFGVDAEVDFPG